ncbi:trypsin-like serine protease [Kitasatospora sp. NRRL B-11411]|uniref:trypsin-like serine protease n=1 Tax=Kitasatospora sp. NRRL B-11411 TaxID=1463822 RepID=UPI00069034B5|nr:trypsin-like serine protease [Kitasatospora sp. NRRL B-11411]
MPGAAVPPALAGTTASDVPSAVEDGAYPDAARILQQTGVTLKAGDGHITLADCSGDYQVKVWTGLDQAQPAGSIVCFKTTGATGYLSLTVPEVFGIATYADRSLTAQLSAAGATSSVDVGKNQFKAVGESAPGGGAVATLLELRVTGPAAPTTTPNDPATAFTAQLAIGGTGRTCTGTLVDPQMILTAKSCFADDPANPGTVTAGAPKNATTATIGRTDLNATGGQQIKVVALAPHADRDLVMARLETPVTGVAPIALATTAPANGGVLNTAGYGRTATAWAPGTLHTPAATTGAVTASGFDLTPTAPGLICKGDAGAPLWRTENSKPALVGIISRSWQGGCLGTDTTETRTTAYAERTDDLGNWVDRTRRDAPSGTQVKGSPYSVIDPTTGHPLTFVQDSSNHLWSADPQDDGWHDLGAYAATSPTAIVNPANQHVMVYVNGPNNRLWSYDRTTAVWTQFVLTPSGTALAPAAVPHTIVNPADGHLVTYIKDTASHLWSVDPQGEGWYDFGALAATDPIPVINPNDNHIVVYVNGPNNRLNAIDRNGTGRTEYTATTSGTVLAGDAVPSVVVNPANGHFTAFIRDTDHHLWSVDPWGAGWRDHGAMAATDPVATVDTTANRVTVHVNGPDHRLNSLNFATGAWTLVPLSPAGKAMADDTTPHTVTDPTTKHLVTFLRDNHDTLWSYDPTGNTWNRITGGPSLAG